MRVQGLILGFGHLMLSENFQRKGESRGQLPTQGSRSQRPWLLLLSVSEHRRTLSQALVADAAPSGREMGYFFQFYRKPINQREVTLYLCPWVTELVKSHAENQPRGQIPCWDLRG